MDIPIDVYFNGQWPSVSFRVGDTYGDVPINPSLMQRDIYYSGKRYWGRWVPQGREPCKGLPVWAAIVLALMVVIAGVAAYVIGRSKRKA